MLSNKFPEAFVLQNVQELSTVISYLLLCEFKNNIHKIK